MNTVKVEHGKTLMVAHRGVSGLEKENTCAAFVAAGNRSYFGIETDVHKTADGRYIIIHDHNMKRLVGIDDTVENCNYEFLRAQKMKDTDGLYRYDLGLPVIDEYIRICKKYDKKAVLELKNDFNQDDVNEIIGIIESYGMLENTIFISFYYNALLNVRNCRPGQKCMFLSSTWNEDLLKRMFEDGLDFDVYEAVLTEELIKRFHDNGLEVNVWTVDNKDNADKYISWGVDYITTNILE